jgi:imidazole glycerol-phosphate synthase subunit HisF
MLTRRIIVCLDVDAGRVVKGVQFTKLRDAGDPAELAAAHAAAGADEIVLLDITATHEKRATLLETVRRTAREMMVPFTVGGGIRSVDDASAVYDAGADKVAVNSAALADPTLITQIAAKFGSQAAVVAIDARASADGSHFEVKKTGGRDATGRDAVTWAREAQEAGAGEFLVTSMDRDGTQDGFDMELTRAIAAVAHIPVIASGGAGAIEHFVELFQPGAADAALAASIFHFGLIHMSDLKQHLQQNGVPVRWPC